MKEYLIPVNDYDCQVPFGGNITYTCKEGFFFEDEIEMESHSVFCEGNGSFSNLPLKRCISAKREREALSFKLAHIYIKIP